MFLPIVVSCSKTETTHGQAATVQYGLGRVTPTPTPPTPPRARPPARPLTQTHPHTHTHTFQKLTCAAIQAVSQGSLVPCQSSSSPCHDFRPSHTSCSPLQESYNDDRLCPRLIIYFVVTRQRYSIYAVLFLFSRDVCKCHIENTPSLFQPTLGPASSKGAGPRSKLV